MMAVAHKMDPVEERLAKETFLQRSHTEGLIASAAFKSDGGPVAVAAAVSVAQLAQCADQPSDFFLLLRSK